MKREAKYQTRFNQWLKDNKFPTACFELKQTQGKALAFSSVESHQLNALKIAKHDTLAYKISDFDMGFRPFDCFVLTCVPAYVVCFFKRNFYLIDVDVWEEEARTLKRKSLTEERAKEISVFLPSFPPLASPFF